MPERKGVAPYPFRWLPWRTCWETTTSANSPQASAIAISVAAKASPCPIPSSCVPNCRSPGRTTPRCSTTCPSPWAPDCTGLIAPNGAGKSTLLKLIAGDSDADRRYRHRARRRSATCRRICRSTPASRWPRSSASHGVIGALDALARGDAGAAGVRRDRRRLGYRGARHRAARPAGPRARRAAPVVGDVVRRRGGVARPGRSTAAPPRRAAARRADQQPRPRRAEQAVRGAGRLPGRCAGGQPRPRPAGPDAAPSRA